MSILSNKPKNLSLIEYFNNLDIFDKRQLIKELEVFKLIIKTSVKNHLFTLIVSLIVGIVCIAVETSVMVISFYSIISIVISILLFRKYLSLIKFNEVINFLQKNM